MMSLDIQTIEAQANLLRNSGHLDEAESLLQLHREYTQCKYAREALLEAFDRTMNALIDTNEEAKRLRRQMQEEPYSCDYYEAYLREKARADRWHGMCKTLLLGNSEE